MADTHETPERSEQKPTIRARIANAGDMTSMFSDMDRLKAGDFMRAWHDFPTTKEEFGATLREIGIDTARRSDYVITGYETNVAGLYERLPFGADADEINYLAAKLAAIPAPNMEVFGAVMLSGRHCDSVMDIINVTENMGLFDVRPAYSAEMYGEFHATMYRDYFAHAIETLEKSSDPYMREFAAHIVKLDDHLNGESYGRALAKEENGVFTEQGYLTESEGFREVYRGPEDIPAEYRVSVPPAREPQERPSALDKLAAAKEAVRTNDAGRPCPDKPKSHDTEL